ncbi:hypothetical protein SLA2020_441160 [Shorea laevis]
MPIVIFNVIVKILDWREDEIATVAETTALRVSFRQCRVANVTKVKLTFASVHNVMLSCILGTIYQIL